MTVQRWWGEVELPQKQVALWQINALQLAIQHLTNEWFIFYDYDAAVEWQVSGWQYHTIDSTIELFPYPHQERYVFQDNDPSLFLTPILADRPLINRPIVPLFIQPKEEIQVYTSLPLWVRVEMGESKKLLTQMPIRRPSDTWFGPSTLEGELCYAGRSSCRLRLEAMPLRAHRAITKIIIHNQASETLQVDRLSLPVMYLSLFSTEDGMLWTEDVTMVRTRNTGMADMQIADHSPLRIGPTELVSEPRLSTNQNIVIRAFEALFKKGA